MYFKLIDQLVCKFTGEKSFISLWTVMLCKKHCYLQEQLEMWAKVWNQLWKWWTIISQLPYTVMLKVSKRTATLPIPIITRETSFHTRWNLQDNVTADVIISYCTPNYFLLHTKLFFIAHRIIIYLHAQLFLIAQFSVISIRVIYALYLEQVNKLSSLIFILHIVKYFRFSSKTWLG